MSQTQEQAASNQSDQPSDDRVARFRADVAGMHLRDPRAGRERVWMFIGGALMVIGVVLAILAYFQSSGATAAYNTEGPATQRDAITIGLIGVSVSVIGAAIFLRYSLAQFFRFWLARLIYEQQAATDRIVESRSS
ncbi:MAG: hypothetical protein ACRDV7_05965 [Acidimicrobiia bacterium]|jgi:uncharacterized membrane protein YidH (DUF202 family)